MGVVLSHAALFKAGRLALALLATACVGAVHAQAYPERSISMVWPSVPGSSTDNILRALASEAGKKLGQTVLVENRPGANGTLGLSAMMRSRPDGYTVNIAPHGVLIHLPLIDPNFRIEVEKDYVPIVFMLEFPLVIAANPGLPYKDIKGLIAYAKANPGKANFAVQRGTVSHFFAELLSQTAGISITMVPYKSSTAALPDLMAGRVDMATSSTTVKPLVESGKLMVIAVSSKERWAPYPNVPTLIESGLPMSDSSWYVMVAGAGTPKDILEKLRRAFSESMKLPNIVKMYADAGLISLPDMKPEELVARINAERSLWGPVIRKAGIKLD